MSAKPIYSIAHSDLSSIPDTLLEPLLKRSGTSCSTASFFEKRLPSLKAELSSLLDSRVSLTISQKQIFVLKAAKSIFGFLNTLDSDTEHRVEIDQLRSNFVEMFAKSSQEKLVSTCEFFEPWIEEIISCRKLFELHLPPASFQPGHSKGILYKIKKETATVGYLFGTAHHLITPELQKTAHLSSHIYHKLCKCILMGTETKIGCQRPEGKSVEKKLFQVAIAQGIVNFGIDSPDRDLIDDLNSISGDEDISEQEYLKVLSQVHSLVEAYQAGDTKRLETLLNLMHAEQADEPDEERIEQVRNSTIANNIHAFLEASARAANKLGETRIPRSFFAIGTFHLLFNTSTFESVPAKLSKLGWDLLPID